MRKKDIQLANIFILISMGLWGYMDKNAPTALIPFFGGLVLWVFLPSSNRLSALILVLLVAGLVMPLRRSLTTGDALGVCRSALMLVACLGSLAVIGWPRRN